MQQLLNGAMHYIYPSQVFSEHALLNNFCIIKWHNFSKIELKTVSVSVNVRTAPPTPNGHPTGLLDGVRAQYCPYLLFSGYCLGFEAFSLKN